MSLLGGMRSGDVQPGNLSRDGYRARGVEGRQLCERLM